MFEAAAQIGAARSFRDWNLTSRETEAWATCCSGSASCHS